MDAFMAVITPNSSDEGEEVCIVGASTSTAANTRQTATFVFWEDSRREMNAPEEQQREKGAGAVVAAAEAVLRRRRRRGN
jgi:hypothetical protein